MNLQLFKKIIETNSIYPNEHELWNFLFDYLQQLWFGVEKQYLNPKFCENDFDKTRFNVLAQKWEWEKCILFYAHMDTVPVHDEKLWKTNPLEFVQDEANPNIYRWLWVVDMKWGLFAILEAIKDFQPNWYKLKVVFWADEECWSKWAHTLIFTNYMEDVDLCIVPELWDAEWAREFLQNIILWRRWRFLIKLDVPWKSCHWANAPTLWINAITQASIIAQEIDNKYQITKSHERMPNWNQFIKYFHSSVSSLSVPDLATLYIDRHILPWETQESVMSEIKTIIDNLYIEWKLKDIQWQKVNISFYERPTPAWLAYETPVENEYVQMITNVVKKYYNDNYRYSYGLSVADENVFANAKKWLPVITLWPVWWNEHWANERVSIKSIENLILIYKDLLEKFNK